MYQAFYGDEVRSQPRSVAERAPRITPAVLTLPILAPSVPVFYVSEDEAVTVNLAIRMALAGLITEEDRKAGELLQQVIDRVLHREILAATGKLQTLQLDAAVLTRSKIDFEQDDMLLEENQDSQVAFVISLASHIPEVRIEQAVERLNALHPDLGQTLYAILDANAWSSLHIATFASVIASRTYELLYDCDYYDNDEDESAWDGPHQIAELLGQFPYLWVANPKAMLSTDELQQIAQNLPQGYAKDAIQAALDIAFWQEPGQRELGQVMGGYPSVYEAARISFADHDPTEELVDEALNVADGCCDSYTTNLHQEFFDLSTQEAFETWWAGKVTGFKLLGAIDRLLTAFSLLNEKG